MWDVVVHIAWAVLGGFVVGLGLSYVICKTRGTIKSIVLFGSNTGAIIAVIALGAEVTKITYIHVIALLVAIITTLLFLMAYVNGLRKKVPDLLVGVHYLLISDRLGEVYDGLIEDYVNNKKAELEVRDKELQNKEIALDMKLNAAKRKVEELVRKERDLDDKLLGDFQLKLPVEKNVALGMTFVQSIPKYLDGIFDFLDYAGDGFYSLAEDNDHNDPSQRPVLIDAYLGAISRGIGEILFDRTARVHFRRLDNGFYKAFYVHSRNQGDEVVSAIPADKESMIVAAARSGRSLVRSVNPEFDYETTNKWSDYLTAVFGSFIDDGKPLITMTISVRHDSLEQRNMLRFLSFICFERILDDYLLQIQERLDLRDYLSNFRSGVA